MKAVLLALALLQAPAVAESEFVNSDGDFVRFNALPCKHAEVLAYIPAHRHPDFREAYGVIEGKRHNACWTPIFAEQMVYVRYDDGEYNVIPFAFIRPVKKT